MGLKKSKAGEGTFLKILNKINAMSRIHAYRGLKLTS